MYTIYSIHIDTRVLVYSNRSIETALCIGVIPIGMRTNKGTQQYNDGNSRKKQNKCEKKKIVLTTNGAVSEDYTSGNVYLLRLRSSWYRRCTLYSSVDCVNYKITLKKVNVTLLLNLYIYICTPVKRKTESCR